MKIAVISDIHGNQYALKEVLKMVEKNKADHILVLGDIVGYYYHPEIILSMLSKWEHTLIRGNHEVLLQGMLSGKIEESELKRKYGSGHRFAANNLSKIEIEKLVSAPDFMKISFDKTKILMCHGSPWNPDYYLYPDTSEDLLKKCDEPNTDFVLIGHSHYSFAYKNKYSMLINPGSVGQSRNVGGVAFWSMINTANNSFEIMATPYETSELLKEVKLIDPENTYLSEILIRNRN